LILKKCDCRHKIGTEHPAYFPRGKIPIKNGKSKPQDIIAEKEIETAAAKLRMLGVFH
jgi:hypothetical protein